MRQTQILQNEWSVIFKSVKVVKIKQKLEELSQNEED